MGEFLDKQGLERFADGLKEKMSTSPVYSLSERVVGDFCEANLYEKTYIISSDMCLYYGYNYKLDDSLNIGNTMLINYYGMVNGAPICGNNYTPGSDKGMNPIVSLYDTALYFMVYGAYNVSYSNSDKSPGPKNGKVRDRSPYSYVTVRYIKTTEIDLSSVAIAHM